FTVKELAVSSQWDTDTEEGSGNETPSERMAIAGYDAAVAVVNENNSGERLGNLVGMQDIQFKPPQGGEFIHVFGYPKGGLNKDGNYSGSRMVHCAGPASSAPKADKLWGVKCDMSSGSSGGPNFVNFDNKSGRGVVVGVTTTSDDLVGGDKPTLYATRLGDSAQRLYDWAEGASL
ncbi:trypsin-like serine peptidase, partial [Streptomyces vinaceus]|uniref:trypsin-like serine peptidase n=1 Tax=Streptomyces vinaceus TaxID=1960 RepID=UPI0035DF0DB0